MSDVRAMHCESEAGFTLTGVLAGLAIFSVLGLGMLEITSEVYYRQDLNRQTMVATALAQSKAEELLGAGYDDPRLRGAGGGKGVVVAGRGESVAVGGRWDHDMFVDPDHADRDNPLDPEGETEGDRTFTRVWNVDADVPLPGLKTVTVLVGWHDARGQQHVVSQIFHIARLR